MNERLKELYKKVILKHQRAPYHYAAVLDATRVLEAYNPLCGDKFQLYLHEADNTLQSIHFQGFGCAISKASTSVLAQQLEGKTYAEAAVLCADFFNSIETGNSDVDDFAAFAAAKHFPGRRQCAILPWTALQEYLKKASPDTTDDAV